MEAMRQPSEVLTPSEIERANLWRRAKALRNCERTLEEEVEGLEISGGWVDHGIGPYEYWGATGVDVCWQFEHDAPEEFEATISIAYFPEQFPEDEEELVIEDGDEDALVSLPSGRSQYDDSTEDIRYAMYDTKKVSVEESSMEWVDVDGETHFEKIILVHYKGLAKLDS